MEKSPITGGLKVAAFTLLAFTVFMTVWQKSKLEDKLVELDRGVQDLETTVRDMKSEITDGLRENERSLEKIAGANDTLIRILQSGGVRYGPGPEGPVDTTIPRGVTTGTAFDPRTDWGWKYNEIIDRQLDPSRPVGTPGRYKNYFRLDPDGVESPLDAPNRDGETVAQWSSEPRGFNFLTESYASLSDYCEIYVGDGPGLRHWKKPASTNFGPRLAWRVEVSPDYKEYTIFFRRDAHWHPPLADVRKYPHLAGKKRVTAHDYKFTIDIIVNPQSNAASIRSYYEGLESVDVIDDYTVVVRWDDTRYNSLYWTMGMTVMPRHVYAYDQFGTELPKETIGQEFNDHWYDNLRLGPMGCGPYRFDKYETGKFLRIKRWDDWYGYKDMPKFPLKTITRKIYLQSDTDMNRLRANEVDTGGLTGSKYRDWVVEEKDMTSPFKDGRIVTFKVLRPRYLYFAWKNTDPLFEDKRVRKALTFACNRQEICDKIFLGRYTPMSSPIFPGSVQADPALKPLPFDLSKARELLDAAGWKVNEESGLREKIVDGQPLKMEFTLYWPGPSPEFQAALNQYKNDLLKINIKMEPLSLEWAQFQTKQKAREFKAFSLLWVMPGWEHTFRQIWHSDQIQVPQSSNYIEFSNKELDALQDQLEKTMEPDERTRIVRRIGRILYEEQPYTFFGWQYGFLCHWNYVHNLKEHLYRSRPFLRMFPTWIER